MHIKVRNPAECPLRRKVYGMECTASAIDSDMHMSGPFIACGDDDTFPAKCPLRARMVIVERDRE